VNELLLVEERKLERSAAKDEEKQLFLYLLHMQEVGGLAKFIMQEKRPSEVNLNFLVQSASHKHKRPKSAVDSLK